MEHIKHKQTGTEAAGHIAGLGVGAFGLAGWMFSSTKS